MTRFAFALPLAALWVVAVAAAPAQAGALRLALLEAEVDGDISDSSRRPEWDARLRRLTDRVSDGLSRDGTYEVVDPAPAARLYETHRRRRNVHACEICAIRVAEELRADRVLALHVFRMSNLVLSLHAVLRDGATGEVRYARVLGFRGDNDTSWFKAADYLMRDMADIPSEER
ncbi:DUF2380 domain-containing protein [Lutibaculum baratangense]|nr:DUF2380 domain-containing protein [Lutibaculum baratangense]